MSNFKLVPELYCQDIEVTKKFYSDVFGFKVKYERIEEQFVYFTLDGVDIMVEGINGTGRRWLTSKMDKPFGRGVNFQWDVADIDILYSRVKANAADSIYLEMEVKEYLCADTIAVQKQFIVQDPDGYLFRFCCEESNAEFSIEKGWNSEHSKSVALLYEEAFGQKFSGAIAEKSKRLDILAKSFIPEYSFAALSKGRVVGLAGFQVASGSLTSGIGAKRLMDELGVLKGLWACIVFSLFERKPKNRELVMDGIAVNHAYRGNGIGSHLLDRIITFASENHYESIRLDVIDSNPRAKKLYASKGFRTVSVERFPYLKWLIGFSGSTTMTLDVKQPSSTTPQHHDV